MPLQKILFKPGVNRENTRYTTEGGWYECDKVRFRQGNPEVIGGWEPLSLGRYLGVCRSLWNWVTLGKLNLVSVGTNLKFYIERGGAYFDITPIRTTTTLPLDPFTGNGTTTVTVNAPTNGALTGDFVTFSGVTGAYASLLNGEFQINNASTNSYTITVASAIPAGVTGGAAVSAAYQLNTGPAEAIPFNGWGAGAWSFGAWGTGGSTVTALRVWSQGNWGQDLIFGPRNGGIYYWDANTGVATRGFDLATAVGASDVPTVQNYLFISDINRFVFAMGCNDYGSAVQDPMLIRWSDQEDAYNWTPAATNQAGSLRLSHGSTIVTAVQARQEIVVFTDSSLYSLQYLDAPIFWGAQLLGDNISIVGQNAAVIASGIVYWMGVDKFYAYDGRVQTLNCDLRRHVFQDFNMAQSQQVFAGTNEGFNEVWWFYCSQNSTVIDKYVVFNYLENVWYYGTMNRTAWLDSGLREFPMAATYSNTLVYHEAGLNDNVAGTPVPINAYISSSEFDIGDGHNFGFVWRILPDLTFQNSTNDPNTNLSPRVTMSVAGLYNSGSGRIDTASGLVAKTSQYLLTEEFTGQIYTRVRGRQMVFEIESNQLNTAWQLGAPRIDIRPDGRR
jgi:hypothetical protein